MGARVFLRDGSLMPTPRVEAGVVGDPIRIGALVRYGWARASDPLGTANVHALHTGLAASLLLGLVETGPRLELGALFASGDGSRSSSETVFASSFAWEIEAHVRATDSFGILVSLEAAWMWRGLDVRADDRTLLQIGGPFAGASLGFELQ
jgi:hypothetical protein